MDQGILSLLIATVSLFAALSGLIWRMQVVTTRQIHLLRTELSARIDQVDQRVDDRIDQLSARLDDRIDQLNQRVDDRIDQLSTRLDDRIAELRRGQVDLSNRLSRLEGMLVPKPWEDVPAQPEG